MSPQEENDHFFAQIREAKAAREFMWRTKQLERIGLPDATIDKITDDPAPFLGLLAVLSIQNGASNKVTYRVEDGHTLDGESFRKYRRPLSRNDELAGFFEVGYVRPAPDKVFALWRIVVSDLSRDSKYVEYRRKGDDDVWIVEHDYTKSTILPATAIKDNLLGLLAHVKEDDPEFDLRRVVNRAYPHIEGVPSVDLAQNDQ